MSPLRATTRAGRRVVVVRDGPGVAEVARTLRRARATDPDLVEEVADLYDAIAAVGRQTSDAAQRISAVALPLQSLPTEATDVRGAFHSVDPDIRVVLLAPRGASAEVASFDRVVFLPATTQDLVDAFDGMDVEPEARTADMGGMEAAQGPGDFAGEPSMIPAIRQTRAIPAVPTPSPLTSASPQRDAAARTRAPATRRGDMVDRVIDDALQAFAARRGRESAAPRSPEAAPPVHEVPDDAPVADADRSIGDIDLVDAVLEGGDRLEIVASALLRRELQTRDIRISLAHRGADGTPPNPERSVPIRHDGETLGTLASDEIAPAALEPWAEWLGHWARLDRAHSELRVLAWTDELTGAGNRRAFERVLDEAIAAARPERRPVSLMYFDIDNFKSYNDRYGHEAGDEVLRETVELLRSVIRRGDHVFRVGGDEFVVIFADRRGARSAASRDQPSVGGASTLSPAAIPGSGTVESIETITTRFREQVCSLRFPQLGLEAPGSLSISAGVATFPWDGHDAHSLLGHADQLALQSKRNGKNIITFGPGAMGHCRDA